jgi:opacity protein-like surface antigen
VKWATLVAAALFVCAAEASAQSAVPAGRVEAGAGVEWLGASAFGTSAATETTSSGGFATLFSTSSTLKGALGFQAHLGVRITERLEAQAIGAVSGPTLSTTITGDIETSDTVTATDSVRQYVIGGGVLWYFPVRQSPKLTPFVTGNVAYLRQLHETRTLVDTGQLYRVSGGVKYLFASRSGSTVKGYGLRAEGGFVARVKGVAFDSGAHYSPWIAASLFARFGSRR